MTIEAGSLSGSSAARHGAYLRRHGLAPGAAHRLVCLPHAGGSATFYRPVALALQPAVDVLAVQYPGRQDRRTEPCIPTVGQLADQLTDALLGVADRPLTFFGHSMGSTVAFETIRRLQTRGIEVTGLFASGGSAPSIPRTERVHEKTDADLLAELRLLNGTDARMLDHPEVVEMILPVLRSDYQAIETYEYSEGPPLRCPVHVMLGDDDPRVHIDEALAWAWHTTESFTCTTYSGGHFFLTDHLPAVLDQIKRHLNLRS